MGNVLLKFTLNNASSEYTYSDLRIPIRYESVSGDTSRLLDVSAIKQSIRNIFNWNLGERILLPAFGNSLPQHLYSKMSKLTEKNIQVGVRQMLKWEPRVTVTEVKITAYPEENQYDVIVLYEIPQLKVSDSVNVTLNVVT